MLFRSMFGRALSGDTLFQNIYTAERTNGMISIASSFPGSIKAFEITPGNEIILQKSAFLASEAGVELSMHFRKKLGSGLFGGEGFILQKLSGNGIAFAEFDGHVIEYELQPGQQIIIDTGHLAAMSVTCQMDIQTIPGIKNMFLGGEGLFNTVVTGPGHVWLQTMPISNMAGALITYIIAGALQKAAGLGWLALPIGIVLMIGTVVGIKVLTAGKEVAE